MIVGKVGVLGFLGISVLSQSGLVGFAIEFSSYSVCVDGSKEIFV